MARVSLAHVEKDYPNGVRAVRDLTLEVAEGEFLVLVGPSGCGKTTALRMIAGLEEITRGTIAFGDRVVSRLPPPKRDVAMVFQVPALYPHLTAFDNMAFSLRLRGVPPKAIQNQVIETARLLGIEDLLERRPRQLSGGQGQRVALGRALVRRPACFLLDEPLSNLDAGLRVELRTELKRLHQRLSTTTIYVTHDQEEAMTLGQRIAVLRNGRLQQAGPPLEVYHRPVNRFVAGFLGAPPMNFLEGSLVRDPAGLWFDDGGWRLPVPGAVAARLTAWAGRRVVLGVRPEAFRLRPTEGQPAHPLSAQVTLIEPLGDRADVYLASARHPRLVARVDSRDAPAPGATVPLHVDPERVHFFASDEGGRDAADAGKNLCLGKKG